MYVLGHTFPRNTFGRAMPRATTLSSAFKWYVSSTLEILPLSHQHVRRISEMHCQDLKLLCGLGGDNLHCLSLSVAIQGETQSYGTAHTCGTAHTYGTHYMKQLIPME